MDRISVRVVQLEGRQQCPCAIDEQQHGVALGGAADRRTQRSGRRRSLHGARARRTVGRGAGLRQSQRCELVHRLARDAERFPARDQDADVRARLQHVLGECRARVREVLAVVEDEEQALLAQNWSRRPRLRP